MNLYLLEKMFGFLIIATVIVAFFVSIVKFGDNHSNNDDTNVEKEKKKFPQAVKESRSEEPLDYDEEFEDPWEYEEKLKQALLEKIGDKTYRGMIDDRDIDSPRYILSQGFLSDQSDSIIQMINDQDFESALFQTKQALSQTFYQRDSWCRHFFLLGIISCFYSLRDINPLATAYCLAVCDIDMMYLDSMRLSQTPSAQNGSFCMESPTRKAIILEKQGDIQGAIDVCDWAIDNNIWDSNKNSFLGRKARLLKKLQNNK